VLPGIRKGHGTDTAGEMSRNRPSRPAMTRLIWLRSATACTVPVTAKGLLADSIAGLLSQVRSRVACYMMKGQVLLATGPMGD
jgi:hypothetical protein